MDLKAKPPIRMYLLVRELDQTSDRKSVSKTASVWHAPAKGDRVVLHDETDPHIHAVVTGVVWSVREDGELSDVTVEAEGNVLTIRGEKRSEQEEKKERARWTERSYGSFSRSFTLPPNAESERVAASFRDGVLSIEIPKSEEAKPKIISIKSR